jgi:hypothetical protein
LCEVDKDE